MYTLLAKRALTFASCESLAGPSAFRHTLYVYKSSCRASPACERIRVSIDRASRRKTFKCVHGAPFVGRGPHEEMLGRAKCIPIGCGKKRCSPLGHEIIRELIAVRGGFNRTQVHLLNVSYILQSYLLTPINFPFYFFSFGAMCAFSRHRFDTRGVK